MTPEQEEQVRRALAAESPHESTPSDVTARLEATLARLVEERGSGASATPAPVDQLERRRRRRWPRVLVAAASVTVLAYGVGVVVEGLQFSGGDAAMSTQDETAADGPADDSGAGAESGGGAGAAESAPSLVPGTGSKRRDADSVTARRALTGRTLRLHRATLRDDVRPLLGDLFATYDTRGERDAPKAATVAPRRDCTLPATARGDRIAAARLDGLRATLVLRKPTAGTVVAEVYSCDDPSQLLALTRLRPSR